MADNRKKIILLATGGTIASAKRGAKGPLLPVIKALELLDFVPQVFTICEPAARDILNLDSSNIQPEEWQIIAREIAAALEDYDGVVITHGTDTLAFTASAMSYMLRALQKPVIFTGAQLPIRELMSDGRRNLESAFATAALGVPGVYIVFDNQIINAARSTKLRSMGFNAFASINVPACGTVDSRGVLIRHPQPRKDAGTGYAVCRLEDALCPDVFLLKIIPGTKPELFDCIVDLGYRGVVIEAFGVGGMHYLHRNLIAKIDALCEAGLVVVIISQCQYDAIDLSIYEAGTQMPKRVISGYDMTAEAAVTKLMWALGQTDSADAAAALMQTSLVGEF